MASATRFTVRDTDSKLREFDKSFAAYRARFSPLKSLSEEFREFNEEFHKIVCELREGIRQDLREFIAGIKETIELESDSPKDTLESQISDSQNVDSENEFPHQPVIGKISPRISPLIPHTQLQDLPTRTVDDVMGFAFDGSVRDTQLFDPGGITHVMDSDGFLFGSHHLEAQVLDDIDDLLFVGLANDSKPAVLHQEDGMCGFKIVNPRSLVDDFADVAKIRDVVVPLVTNVKLSASVELPLIQPSNDVERPLSQVYSPASGRVWEPGGLLTVPNSEKDFIPQLSGIVDRVAEQLAWQEQDMVVENDSMLATKPDKALAPEQDMKGTCNQEDQMQQCSVVSDQIPATMALSTGLQCTPARKDWSRHQRNKEDELRKAAMRLVHPDYITQWTRIRRILGDQWSVQNCLDGGLAAHPWRNSSLVTNFTRRWYLCFGFHHFEPGGMLFHVATVAGVSTFTVSPLTNRIWDAGGSLSSTLGSRLLKQGGVDTFLTSLRLVVPQVSLHALEALDLESTYEDIPIDMFLAQPTKFHQVSIPGRIVMKLILLREEYQLTLQVCEEQLRLVIDLCVEVHQFSWSPFVTSELVELLIPKEDYEMPITQSEVMDSAKEEQNELHREFFMLEAEKVIDAELAEAHSRKQSTNGVRQLFHYKQEILCTSKFPASRTTVQTSAGQSGVHKVSHEPVREVQLVPLTTKGEVAQLALQTVDDLAKIPATSFKTIHSFALEFLLMLEDYAVADLASRVRHRWKIKEINERTINRVWDPGDFFVEVETQWKCLLRLTATLQNLVVKVFSNRGDLIRFIPVISAKDIKE